MLLDSTPQVLTNNSSWNEQDMEALMLCVPTNVLLMNSSTFSQMSSTKPEPETSSPSVTPGQVSSGAASTSMSVGFTSTLAYP